MTIKPSTTCKKPTTLDELASEDWVTVHQIPTIFPELPVELLKRQLAAREQNGLHQYVKTSRNNLYVSVRGYGFWFVNKMAGVHQAMESDRAPKSSKN